MGDLVFVDAPPPGRIPPWVSRLTPLLAHPNQWVDLTTTYHLPRVARTIRSTRSRLERGTPIPPGRWEFVVRDLHLYARYLGPDESEA